MPWRTRNVMNLEANYYTPKNLHDNGKLLEDASHIKMVIFRVFRGVYNSLSWVVWAFWGGILLQNHYAYGIWLRYSRYNLPKQILGTKKTKNQKNNCHKSHKKTKSHSNNLTNVYWLFQKGCDHPTSLRLSSNSSLKFQSFSVVGDTFRKSDNL